MCGRFRVVSCILAALTPVVLMSCDGSDADPASPGPSFVAADLGAGDGKPDFEFIEVCKYGSAADISVTMTQGIGQSTVTYSFSDGECRVLGDFDSRPGYEAEITVQEVESSLPAGVSFDHLRYTVVHRQPGVPGSETEDPPVTSSTNPFTAHGDQTNGYLVEFFNVRASTGGEGCTPGYWKQSQHFDSWVGYAPGQQFSSVFENAFPGMTLLQVLQQGGGGLNALGRHTVAALLNSSGSGVDFDLSTSQVIAAFNAVFPGGNYSGQKNIFEALNEQGCPLN
jgi:hypothetical protein